MNTETLDQLYLEWSHFTTVKTARVLELEGWLGEARLQRDAAASRHTQRLSIEHGRTARLSEKVVVLDRLLKAYVLGDSCKHDNHGLCVNQDICPAIEAETLLGMRP